jgi:type II secretory pathway pseudopilin PulG
MARLMSPGSRQAGFTYLIALLSVAAIAVAVAATLEVWSTTRERQKESDLLWVGTQFKRAIGLYYERSPGAARQYPRTLEDLLEDHRFISMQRYLRRIYSDPLTGKQDWILIPGPDGGIKGVQSASTVPVRSVVSRDQSKGWQFIYEPATGPSTAPTKQRSS